MTSEQVQRYVRYAIYLAAGYLARWGVGLDNATLDAIVPLVMVVVGIAWSMYGNRINAKISEVAKYADDPRTPVKGIIVAPNAEGKELAQSTDGPVQVAGTIAAVKMAGLNPEAIGQ